MTTWNPPADVDLAAGKPGKPSHARAIRDLSSALAERASGAPWLNGIGAEVFFAREVGTILSYPPAHAGERSLITIWTVPEGVFNAEVILIGGGGAGGDGVRYDDDGFIIAPGGGGGAGAVRHAVLSVEPGQVYQIKVGAGGRRDAIHPSVDTGLDDFAIGDGARTTFGNLIAAGGKCGVAGSLGGAGGAGGNYAEPSYPTFQGADGKAALVGTRSGSGGTSIYGGGAPGRWDTGEGYSAYYNNPANHQEIYIPGAGGGGGYPETTGGPDTEFGGRGANGAVIVRY